MKNPARGGAFRQCFERGPLQGNDVGSLRALRAGGDFEAHLRAFGQALEARTADRAEVDEDVIAATVLRNKAEALRVVEPLHGSSSAGHNLTYLFDTSNVAGHGQTTGPGDAVDPDGGK